MEKNTNRNASRMQTTLTLVSTRVLPVVVNSFRNKLIGVVLAGLVLPQMAYAGHGGGGHGGGGGGGGGNRSGGSYSGGNSSARSMRESSNSNKSYSQKSSSVQNGGQKQFAKTSTGQPIPAKNGNTGINGSGLPDKIVPFKNGNTGFTGIGKPQNSQTTQSFVNKNFATKTADKSSLSQSLGKNGKTTGGKISGADKVAEVNTVKPNQSWKQFSNAKVTKTDKATGVLKDTGIKQSNFDKAVTKDTVKPSSPTGTVFNKGDVVKPVDKIGIKTSKDFDKVVNKGGIGGVGTGTGGKGTGGTGTGTGGAGTGTGTGTAGTGTGTGGTGTAGTGTGGTGTGTGGGMGQGNGMGGGMHGHGFPWWAFVTPAFGYPGYNNGYGQGGVYQQPVYNNAPVYNDAPVVDQAPVTPANYTAPVPAPAATQTQPINGQPVNGNSDGYIDLVLENVEFLEPATVTVGPLYQVKVRNQGTMRADKFRVGAFAQLEGELSDDAPRATTEVTSLGAGETASVTLRLPSSAMKLISTSAAGAAAFNQLLVVVDLDDAVVEIEKSNNVANLDRAALESAAAAR